MVVVGVSEGPEIKDSKRRCSDGRGFGLAISRRLPPVTIIS
jgi:hypothetical protein